METLKSALNQRLPIVDSSARLQWPVEWGLGQNAGSQDLKVATGGLVETRLPGRDLKVPPIQTTNTGGGGGPVLWGQKRLLNGGLLGMRGWVPLRYSPEKWVPFSYPLP